jgi:hypothetical protein
VARVTTLFALYGYTQTARRQGFGIAENAKDLPVMQVRNGRASPQLPRSGQDRAYALAQVSR